MEAYGIVLPEEAISRSIAFIGLLERWNRSISLTSVSDMGELARHHLFEAFYVEKLLALPVKCVADIGSGAGFPGIPMHILNPARDTILIEKNLKKATFLSAALRELSLPGRVINRPVEDSGVWQEVDLATVRALKLSSLALERLREAGTTLLILEGKEGQLKNSEMWQMELEKKLPFSENRWARIYHP